MEYVSFEVAKAIKEAGYPQESDKVYLPDGVFCNYISHFINYYAAPTYFDVWLWIWREKKIAIPVDYFGYDNNYWTSCVPLGNDKFEFFEPLKDPEDTIIAAITYMVNKNLLK